MRLGHALAAAHHEQGTAMSSPLVGTGNGGHPHPITRTGSYIFSDNGSSKMFSSDVMSMRSLASIGMGSTDGKKMVIRRVPTSPTELLSIMNQPG